MRRTRTLATIIAATTFGGLFFSASPAFAQGQGCDAISFQNNTATVDCYNLGTTKTVIATLNVDCQPWSPNVKDTASISPGGSVTLSASCFGWGKAVGGSASVS